MFTQVHFSLKFFYSFQYKCFAYKTHIINFVRVSLPAPTRTDRSRLASRHEEDRGSLISFIHPLLPRPFFILQYNIQN